MPPRHHSDSANMQAACLSRATWGPSSLMTSRRSSGCRSLTTLAAYLTWARSSLAALLLAARSTCGATRARHRAPTCPSHHRTRACSPRLPRRLLSAQHCPERNLSLRAGPQTGNESECSGSGSLYVVFCTKSYILCAFRWGQVSLHRLHPGTTPDKLTELGACYCARSDAAERMLYCSLTQRTWQWLRAVTYKYCAERCTCFACATPDRLPLYRVTYFDECNSLLIVPCATTA